jgi:hypothetical protein
VFKPQIPAEFPGGLVRLILRRRIAHLCLMRPARGRYVLVGCARLPLMSSSGTRTTSRGTWAGCGM